MVILFGDGIFCGKPQILLRIQRILKTCLCKAADRLFRIMYALKDSRSVKCMNHFPCLRAILCGKHKFCLPGPGHLYLRVLIYISVSMSGQCNRLLPVAHTGFYSLNDNRCAEHSAIQRSTNCPIGAFPHLFEVIFFHTRRIGGNGGTFHSHTIFSGSLRTVQCHLIFCGIAVFQPQVVILCFQINIGK